MCIIVHVVMDELLKNTYLYDFYGDLLTEHQRKIYEAVVFEDLSLSEASESLNISRQGVHDIIKRCNAAMNEYESRLHLVDKFLSIRKKAEKIKKLAETEPADTLSIIKEADALIEEL